ncbi:MAG: diadenylate cyclase [Acholeplasmatales bacterium]|nr:diadenylate cyclase [Acholeplasmatales bacterium]
MPFLSLIEPISGVSEFFDNNPVARIIIDAYLALFIVSLIVFLTIKFKKALILVIIGLIMLGIYYFALMGGFVLSTRLYEIALTGYVVICAVILAPELRKMMEFHKSTEASKASISSTQATIEAVADAVFDMSAVKVGALITIEQHISLEQYAERAIALNSDISKELLEQIFIKDSPLHDGGVIIRGNKIICAAAYYTLTQDTSLDKTIGSRHRAGVGISEITDSLTIIVSEETGHVHVANQGFMKQIDNKNDLLDYLNTYLGNL